MQHIETIVYVMRRVIYTNSKEEKYLFNHKGGCICGKEVIDNALSINRKVEPKWDCHRRMDWSIYRNSKSSWEKRWENAKKKNGQSYQVSRMLYDLKSIRIHMIGEERWTCWMNQICWSLQDIIIYKGLRRRRD